MDTNTATEWRTWKTWYTFCGGGKKNALLAVSNVLVINKQSLESETKIHTKTGFFFLKFYKQTNAQKNMRLQVIKPLVAEFLFNFCFVGCSSAFRSAKRTCSSRKTTTKLFSFDKLIIRWGGHHHNLLLIFHSNIRYYFLFSCCSACICVFVYSLCVFMFIRMYFIYLLRYFSICLYSFCYCLYAHKRTSFNFSLATRVAWLRGMASVDGAATVARRPINNIIIILYCIYTRIFQYTNIYILNIQMVAPQAILPASLSFGLFVYLYVRLLLWLFGMLCVNDSIYSYTWIPETVNNIRQNCIRHTTSVSVTCGVCVFVCVRVSEHYIYVLHLRYMSQTNQKKSESRDKRSNGHHQQ